MLIMVVSLFFMFFIIGYEFEISHVMFFGVGVDLMSLGLIMLRLLVVIIIVFSNIRRGVSCSLILLYLVMLLRLRLCFLIEDFF